jgi:uncharacterized protein YdaU (DUF1376 family)
MKAPAFQFYAQDFLTGCTYLTNEEIGMYIKMLCKQWTDGKIPKKRLGFLLGLEWVSLSDELKSKFEDLGEFIINKRLEIEREKKVNFREKQAENGKKGGRPKKIDSSEDTEKAEKKTQTKPKPFKNIKPNDSQKKPLEEEDENRNKKIEEVKEKEKIDFPFFTEKFKVQWQLWKAYKSKEFGFKYKSIQSEQASLSELSNLAQSKETLAILIINQSIAKGWKGFFELKNTIENGKANTNISFAKNR